MHQQLLRAQGILVKDISLLIGADMHAEGKELAFVYVTVGILQIYVTCTERFYLCAEELDACLVGFKYKIIVSCLSVVGNDFSLNFHISLAKKTYFTYILPHFFGEINRFFQTDVKVPREF